MNRFVAKLGKSFGGLCNAAESLEEFCYRKVCFQQRRMLQSVALAERRKPSGACSVNAAKPEGSRPAASIPIG